MAPGQGYGRLRAAFTDLLTDRWYALLVTTKYLGGATIARDHRGDPDARPAFATFRPSGSARRCASSPRPASASTPIGSARSCSAGWGRNAGCTGEPGSAGRADFPLHEWALAQQGSLLGQLLDPAVLARIRDAELRALPGEPTLGLPELFETLTRSIWASWASGRARTGHARSIVSVRRDLQRLHLNAMIALLVEPAAGTPEDARALARATLAELAGGLAHALDEAGTDLDAYTRAHLADSRERIARALDAQMIQHPPPSGSATMAPHRSSPASRRRCCSPRVHGGHPRRIRPAHRPGGVGAGLADGAAGLDPPAPGVASRGGRVSFPAHDGIAASTPPLLVRGLRKRYGDVVAVDGLDLEIRPGECFGLLGPNGAGKTTTIEICEGLTPPDEGEVLVLGRRWGEDDRELRELLGISLQETQFSEKLTVDETIRLFRSFYRRGPTLDG